MGKKLLYLLGFMVLSFSDVFATEVFVYNYTSFDISCSMMLANGNPKPLVTEQNSAIISPGFIGKAKKGLQKFVSFDIGYAQVFNTKLPRTNKEVIFSEKDPGSLGRNITYYIFAFSNPKNVGKPMTGKIDLKSVKFFVAKKYGNSSKWTIIEGNPIKF